jgi:hypothetical protein
LRFRRRQPGKTGGESRNDDRVSPPCRRKKI